MTTEHPDEEHHSTNNNHPTVDKKKQQHHRSRSSKKERSSRRQRNSSGSHDNNNNDDEQHRSSSRPSSARDGHHTKKKKKTERRHKNKTSNSSSKQKSSSSRGTMQNPSPPPPKKTEGGGGGVTVSQFLVKQQTIQNEVSTYKNNSMVRQRMMYEQQFDDDDDDEGEASTQHYFDENDSDDDNNNNNNSGAIVAHNNNNPPRRTMKVGQQVVDTLPADHPSSSTIQTHRTCSLCQRTLPRSQFSERDAFTINLSLSPSGITCRTCTMTVSAVKLKSMPETEQLLLDYASRGVQQGLLAIEAQGRGNAGQVAGYLTSNNNSSSEMNNNNDSGALIVRQNTADGNGSITGKELTLFSNNGQSPNNNNNNNNMESYTNLMGLSSPSAARDVNTTFSGRSYAHTDSDRPANIANCKYIDALLQLPCYLNLNAFGIYKSSHDVSVSMSCLEAVRLYGTLDERYFVPHDVDGVPLSEEDDKNKKSKGGGDRGSSLQTNDAQIDDTPVNPKSVVCIVLGEGSTPRTAILASQHYGWTTIAIDPKLSEDWDGCHDDM